MFINNIDKEVVKTITNSNSRKMANINFKNKIMHRVLCTDK